MSISGTFRLIGLVLKEIEFFSIFQVYVYRVLRNSRYTSLVRNSIFNWADTSYGPVDIAVRIYQIFDVPRL